MNIDKDIDKRIQENKYNEHLYHYTSIAKLYSILKDKEFWFGDTETMNDKKEIKNFIELLQKALLDDISADKVSQCEEFFKRVFNRINSEYPYAMCFSELDDDAAQWERYADNAKGVCIVFNTKNIMRVFYEINIIFGRVRYDNNIRKLAHYKILHNYFNTGKLDECGDENGQMDNTIACGYFYKHRSFRSEKEIRVVNLWDLIPNHTSIEIECVQGVIKKFMKFNMVERCKEAGLDFKDLFEGIVIGPKSTQNINSLKAFVEEQGFDTLKNNISKSDCPLR